MPPTSLPPSQQYNMKHCISPYQYHLFHSSEFEQISLQVESDLVHLDPSKLHEDLYRGSADLNMKQDQ